MPTGYEACEDGGVYRAEAVACMAESMEPLACADPVPGVACGLDEDCAEGFPGSACVYVGVDQCGCVRSCTSDADCGDGGVCVCANRPGTHNQCVAVGDCRTDADCPTGQRCGMVVGTTSLEGYDGPVLSQGPGRVAFYCTTEGDECRNDDACEGKLDPSSSAGNTAVACGYDATQGRRVCAWVGPVSD